MTQKMLKAFIVIALFPCLAVGMFTLYKNQKEMYEVISSMRREIAMQQSAKTEVKVIERVTAQQPWGQVQEKTKDTVVHIIAQRTDSNILRPYETPNQGGGSGTGFLISDKGEIITNHHVVNQAQAVWIRIPSMGKMIIDVDVVGSCPERDLALLQIRADDLEKIKQFLGDLPFLEFGDSDFVKRSDEVMALGYPLGQNSLKSTSGVVSGRENMGGQHLIQISAAINPGNSGGPVVNLGAEVVGIACANIPSAQNVGYIIPVNELKMILDELRTGGLLRRPFLGVLFNNGSDQLATYLGNPKPCGCYVVDVYKGSPLSKAGVQGGDMIYEINGHPIDAYGDLNVSWSEDKVSVIDYVGRLEIGQSIDIILYRNGQKKALNFKFGFSEMLPVHKIFPGYDDIKYEIFGGMLIQPLRLNHVAALINNAPSLAQFLEFENQTKDALIITHVVPNSTTQRLEVLREGSIVSEVNGELVGTLDQFRAAISKGIHKDFITFKTTDGVFFVLSPDEVIKDEQKLLAIHKYPLSDFMKKLIDDYNSENKK